MLDGALYQLLVGVRRSVSDGRPSHPRHMALSCEHPFCQQRPSFTGPSFALAVVFSPITPTLFIIPALFTIISAEFHSPFLSSSLPLHLSLSRQHPFSLQLSPLLQLSLPLPLPPPLSPPLLLPLSLSLPPSPSPPPLLFALPFPLLLPLPLPRLNQHVIHKRLVHPNRIPPLVSLRTGRLHSPAPVNRAEPQAPLFREQRVGDRRSEGLRRRGGHRVEGGVSEVPQALWPVVDPLVGLALGRVKVLDQQLVLPLLLSHDSHWNFFWRPHLGRIPSRPELDPHRLV
ncbi:MAG: hypothetical protein Q8P67_08585 [archaeon]|nr:hypothetical protein [archaeon]